MTGYIILAIFIGLVVSHTAVFFIGYSRARKRAELERAEDERNRLQRDREFQKEKEDIQKEVFGNAEEKKASLASGAPGRDRFNNINNSLRDRPKN
ncbi:hypothetical protein AGMMS50268_09630 [Spirochaetia bacterium]|nr:hypothetical protein AGMMS50268_09630 [Spirochaetia bacterium]